MQAPLCRRFRVRRLALFGSSLSSEFDPGRSDLDFVVEFQPLASGGSRCSTNGFLNFHDHRLPRSHSAY
ncbi:MAG: hypothetical protein DMG63_18520 [Acidobacteria bacterium]|nr:MAG: hypothetical protein DMG63_18520 [Acidobacteriota bacterium]